MKYIGIDVSKAYFDVAYSTEKGGKTAKFANSTKGIKSFIDTLPQKDACTCVMEATGNYSALLAYLLDKAGITFCLENPLKVKQFSKAMLPVVKTDKADAKMIALYGERMKPEPYRMQSEKLLLLKQKRTVLRQLQKQLNAMENLSKALSVLPIHDKAADSAAKKTIAFLKKQIAELKEGLEKSTQSEYAKMMELITSIKGIGTAVAAALILSTGAFTYFDSPKQISRYTGICPTYQQSGTSVRIKGHINRNGDPHMRQVLYLAAWTASKYNSACKECYKRLTGKGKPKKVALMAVANKLVRQAFAVVRSGVPYVDGFVSAPPNNNAS